MRAWYMDASTEDQRAPHEQSPPAPCSLEELAKIGVLHWTLDAGMCVIVARSRVARARATVTGRRTARLIPRTRPFTRCARRA